VHDILSHYWIRLRHGFAQAVDAPTAKFAVGCVGTITEALANAIPALLKAFGGGVLSI
jgi:hypothetical protein